MKKYIFSSFNKATSLVILFHLILLIIVVFLYVKVSFLEDLLFKSSQFAVFYDEIKNGILYLILSIIISLFSIVFFINKLLFSPLKLIISALETGNKKCIKLLKVIPGEFGYIGKLFQENNNRNYELVTAKLKAEENEKLKTTFLENLSHEIRTPMNAIIGFTDLLINSNLSESEKKEYLTIIHKSGLGLVSIIEDLIEMSKIDTNQIVPNYTDIDLDKCLTELYNTLKVDIPKSKDIDFYIIPGNARLFYNVKVDEVKLRQIITNLVYNAIKFTQKGYVAFGYEVIEESELAFIEFTVKDTGIGISKENQKTIFDRFKRVESDLTIQKGGLGLGLAISKAYVEMMGGTISIQSNNELGTIFSFRIPLKYDKQNKNLVQEASGKNIENILKNKIILIAEDDNINFLLIKKMLQVTNYEIIRAENGQVAVDLALENVLIDLVLMDIKMPVMNGYEAFEKINLAKPNLPIVAQTAHASEEDKDKILSMGFTDYITKPINKELLLEMVNKYI